MSRRGLLFALAAAALLAAAPAARADDLSFADALALAQQQAPDAMLVKARVEGNKYGFYFWKRPGLIEIEISKSRDYKKRTKKVGSSVSQDVLDMMDQLTKGKTKLPDGRIFEIAAGSLKGTPLKNLDYKVVDGRLVAEVGGNQIDAQTGKVTAVEQPNAK